MKMNLLHWLNDPSALVVWLESHSGLTSFVSLAVSLVSALFKPSTWRRVLATILASSAAFLFLPYEPANKNVWIVKSLFLAFVFNCAVWWIAARFREWRSSGSPLPSQPGRTFQTVVDSVNRTIAESGDSDVRARLSTDAGTYTITKTAGQKKKLA